MDNDLDIKEVVGQKTKVVVSNQSKIERVITSNSYLLYSIASTS